MKNFEILQNVATYLQIEQVPQVSSLQLTNKMVGYAATSLARCFNWVKVISTSAAKTRGNCGSLIGTLLM